MKLSHMNHPSSNLNIGCVFVFGSPVFNKRGVWSDMSLVKALTVDKGNISSHSVLTRIQSNFSKVGEVKLFAHVYLRPVISSSLRSKPSITALNKKGLHYN
jgi:hypothetical protein